MKFSDYLNEKAPEPKQPNKNMVEFVLETMNMGTQFHIFHLLTKSESQHEALGEFYEALTLEMDTLAEGIISLNVDISKYKNEVYQNKLIFIDGDSILLDIVKDYRTKVNTYISETSDAEYAGINDTLINIQKTVDKLLYKLNLK